MTFTFSRVIGIGRGSGGDGGEPLLVGHWAEVGQEEGLRAKSGRSEPHGSLRGEVGECSIDDLTWAGQGQGKGMDGTRIYELSDSRRSGVPVVARHLPSGR
jgi:hypothetical protein